MRVAIVYNQPEPESEGVRAAEYGILEQVRDIETSFLRLGVDSVRHAVTSVTGLVEFLTRVQPQVVFNCCESFKGTAALEAGVASVYDLCGIAYTGSSALTLGISLDKGIAKSLFKAAGVPTPPYVVMRSEPDFQLARELTFPLIVKPLAEDASIGIDASSVVRDVTGLLARVRSLWSVFERPALVEEFIDGREITVALLADPAGAFDVLPVSEIAFGALLPGAPAIVTYDAKWAPESPDYKATPARCPADLEADLAQRIGQVAIAAARAVGLRDYGRVDLRIRAADQAIFVLEVNANPDLSGDAGFMRAAAAGGLTAAATVERILACAVTRARTTRLAPSAGQR